MGQVLSGLGGQYGGGGRRAVGPGQNSGGSPNYIGAPRGYDPTGGVNGPNGNWPGYYLGGGGALPGSGSTSDRPSPYPYSDPLGGQHSGGKADGTGPVGATNPSPSSPWKGFGDDPRGGYVDRTSGGGVDATPDPLGPMTIEKEGGPAMDPKSQPQNPMRRSRGWEQRS